MRFIIALSLLAAAALAAQSQPPAKPGSVAGAVTNLATGAPIRNCTLILNSHRPIRYNTVTDDRGRFLFPKVDPDPGYEPAAQCQGFAMPERTRQTMRDSPPIPVGEDQHVENVSVKLVPLAAIGGKVVDPDGDPLRGVSVQVLQYRYVNGNKRLDVMADSTTDARGQYRLFFLKPGRYLIRAFLRVTPPGPPGLPGHTHSSIPDEGFLPAWYPGVPELAQAAAIDVKPAAELSAYDFRMVRTPVFHIRGKLISNLPKPPAVQVGHCATAFLDRSYLFPADLQPDGAFDARGIPPGQYCLSASQLNWRLVSADAVLTVANRDVEGAVLTAPDGAEISGSVEVEGDPNYKIPKLGLNLQNSATDACCDSIVRQQDDGSFIFRKVPPGTYVFGYANLPPDLYLKSLHLGDRELASDRVEVRSGSPGKLTVILGAGTGQVSGTVQDAEGKPADYTFVTLAPKGDRAGRSDLYYSANTRPDGSFQISGVAPGDYSVFAWEAPQEIRSPEFLKLFADKAASITVSSAGTAPVQVKAIPVQDIEEALWK
jgi:hypothetical protein